MKLSLRVLALNVAFASSFLATPSFASDPPAPEAPPSAAERDAASSEVTIAGRVFDLRSAVWRYSTPTTSARDPRKEDVGVNVSTTLVARDGRALPSEMTIEGAWVLLNGPHPTFWHAPFDAADDQTYPSAFKRVAYGGARWAVGSDCDVFVRVRAGSITRLLRLSHLKVRSASA